LLEEQQRDFNLSSIGETMSVLLDRRGRKPGQLAGRSPYMQAVHVFAPDYLLGQMTALTLTEAHTNSLAAVMAAPNEAADSARELSV
jgi:tRNA-2-methylthio-N6-dimethylallyladenosine synthase